jgi:hypothetical protein
MRAKTPMTCGLCWKEIKPGQEYRYVYEHGRRKVYRDYAPYSGWLSWGILTAAHVHCYRKAQARSFKQRASNSRKAGK